jgi:glycosyltransferase involved in cell wall biosynthesis
VNFELKVDIVVANIEVSGTLKYVGFLARGFTALGHTVRILYSGVGSNSQLVEPVLGAAPRIRWAGVSSYELSRVLVGGPILKFFTDFRPDQSVNLIGNLLGANRFREITLGADLILYANVFAFPPLRLLQNHSHREILIFHESISSTNLPIPLRVAFQAYCRKVAAYVDRSVAITHRTASVLESEGIHALPIPNGFLTDIPRSAKERLVVADSRWGLGRDPFRIVEIAKGVPDAHFVVVGRFQDSCARKSLQDLLEASHLETRVKILGPIPESDLQELYSRAVVALRWGNDRGFTLALVYAVSMGCIPVFSKSIGGSDYLTKEVSPSLVFTTDGEATQLINRVLSDHEFYREMRRLVMNWKEGRTWARVAQEFLDSLSPD